MIQCCIVLRMLTKSCSGVPIRQLDTSSILIEAQSLNSRVVQQRTTQSGVEDLRKYTKPSEFIGWADKLFKLAKKLGVEIRNGDYIGKEALEMEKLGYRLTGQ
jgi:hypothetical protein